MTTKRRLPVLVERAVGDTLALRDDLARRFEATVRSPSVGRKRPTTCRPGCASCCYHPILISLLEAIPLYRWLRREGLWTSRLRDELQRSADRQIGVAYEVWLLSLHPCPLLDTETNRCRAYEARPLLCRTYYATSDPTFCHPHRLGPSTELLDRTDTARSFHEELGKKLTSLGSKFFGLPVGYALLLAERLTSGNLAIQDVDREIAREYEEKT